MRNKVIAVVTLFLLSITSVNFAAPNVAIPTTDDTKVTANFATYGGAAISNVDNCNGNHLPCNVVTASSDGSSRNGSIKMRLGTDTPLPNNYNINDADITIVGNNFDGLGTCLWTPPDLDGDKMGDLVSCVTNNSVRPFILRGSKFFTRGQVINYSDIGVGVAGVRFDFGGVSMNSMAFGDVFGSPKTDIAIGLNDGTFVVIDGDNIPFSGVMNVNNTNSSKFIIGSGKINVSIANMNRGAKKTIIATSENSYIYGIYGQSSFPSIVNINPAFFTTTTGFTINTVVLLNAQATYYIGDNNNDTYDDITAVGEQYQGGVGYIHKQLNIFGGPNLPTSIDLSTYVDGKKAKWVTGMGTIIGNSNDFLIKIAYAGKGKNGIDQYAVADQNNSRVVLIEGTTDNAVTLNIISTEQPGVTKLTGSLLGTSVYFLQNTYGGVGCSVDNALGCGSNKGGNAFGEAYIHRL